jgi:hypothetical protein
MRRISSLILIAAFLFGVAVYAQVTTGTISGTVSDNTGAVLPGAKLEILNEDTGAMRTVQTGAAGRYSAPSLGLGKYQVTSSLEGFQTQVHKGIELTVGREAVVNFDLAVGSISQKVEVTGEAPLVESTSSSLSSTVDDRTIRELPLNGRSYDQLALLQPGIVALGGGTSKSGFDYGSGKRFSVAGSRGSSNSFLLDGTDINDHANGTPGGAAGGNMGVEGIREFKILTNNYNAEYGRASGAVISSVTRSGTNNLHGSAFEFLRNSHLDARNFFDPGSSPPPFRRNQFGGSIGGPIKKDKTFFFGTYEGLRQALANTVISFVPSVDVKRGILPGNQIVTVGAAIKPFLALFPDPNRNTFADGSAEYIFAPLVATNEDYFMTRIDHQLSAKHNLFGRYSFDTDSVNNPSNGSLPNFQSRNTALRQYSTLQMSSILSPALLNNLLFAYNRSRQTSDVLPTSPLGPEFSFVPGRPIGVIQTGGASGVVSAINPFANAGTATTVPRLWAYNLFQFGDDVTYVKGMHSFKTGFRVERIRDNAAENSTLRGAYGFTGLATLVQGISNQFQAVPAGEDAYRGFRQSIIAAYGQDDLKFNSRLTLNLGLRWETATDPTEANGKSSILLHPSDTQLTVVPQYIQISKKNFEPRVGLAWQLNSKGTTVVRAGFGITHDQILPTVYGLNVAKLPPFYHIYTVTNPTFPNGYANLVGSGALTLLTVDHHMKTPTKNQYSVSIQQQLGKDSVVEAAYIGAESLHVIGYSSWNNANPQIVNGQPFFPAALVRQNPAFGAITGFTTDATSNYNGFQVKFTRKSAIGLQFQAFYTFSKAIDLLSAISSLDSQREPQVYLDPQNPARNRGLASFNVAHNLIFNTTYSVPFHFANKAVQTTLGGWSVSAIGTFQSGQPFSPRVGFNNSRDGDSQNPDRPDLLPGASKNPTSGTSAGCQGVKPGTKAGTPDLFYDPCAFAIPTPGTFGNLGRNTIIGPGLVDLDFSLEKNFPIGEKIRAQFRGEFFNLLNHANFGLPTTQVFTSARVLNSTAGKVVDTTTSSRQIQFGLKILF